MHMHIKSDMTTRFRLMDILDKNNNHMIGFEFKNHSFESLVSPSDYLVASKVLKGMD